MKSKFILLLCVLGLSSCAYYGGHRQHTHSTSLVQFLYPKGDLPMTDKKYPVLNLPLKVGLAFIPDQNNSTVISLVGKNNLLEEVKKAFKTKVYVDEITIIPEIYLQRSNGYATLDQIKQLYQLDVIALVSYDQMVNGKDNLLSLSYLTIVGAYIFPGSSYDISTMVDLAVVDVDSRSILFRSAGTSGNKGRAPEVSLDKSTRKKQNKGFVQAMEYMQENLYLELDKFEKRLREKDPNEKIVVRHREGYTGGSVPFSLLLLLSLFTLVKFSARKRI